MNEPILPQIIPIPHSRIKDITGQRFGRLVALGYTGSSIPGGKALWLCQCDCGTKIVTEGKGLRNGNAQSCGCYHRDRAGETSRTHGMTETRMYSIWCNMRTRCNNPNSERYQDYGGRGIYICDRWRTFENFLADMGEPPSDRHTIDRIDNDGNYCPENCRWATPKEQNCNTRVNHIIDYDGKSMNVTQWADHLGVSSHLIHARLKLGWTIQRTLSTPVRRSRKTTFPA